MTYVMTKFSIADFRGPTPVSQEIIRQQPVGAVVSLNLQMLKSLRPHSTPERFACQVAPYIAPHEELPSNRSVPSAYCDSLFFSAINGLVRSLGMSVPGGPFPDLSRDLPEKVQFIASLCFWPHGAALQPLNSSLCGLVCCILIPSVAASCSNRRMPGRTSNWRVRPSLTNLSGANDTRLLRGRKVDCRGHYGTRGGPSQDFGFGETYIGCVPLICGHFGLSRPQNVIMKAEQAHTKNIADRKMKLPRAFSQSVPWTAYPLAVRQKGFSAEAVFEKRWGLVSDADALQFFALTPRHCPSGCWPAEAAQFLDWRLAAHLFGASPPIGSGERGRGCCSLAGSSHAQCPRTDKPKPGCDREAA